MRRRPSIPTRARRHAGGQSLDHARRSAPARRSAACPTRRRSASTARRSARRAFTAKSGPATIRRLFNDSTKTESFELRGSIVPLQSQKSSVDVDCGAGFHQRHRKRRLRPDLRDHIRTAQPDADYRLQDNFGGTNYLTVNWRQGLDIFGASHRGDDFLSRDGASPKFSVLNFWFTRYQTLTDAWSLKLAAAGQAGSGPLFTSQQFYLGGAGLRTRLWQRRDQRRQRHRRARSNCASTRSSVINT